MGPLAFARGADTWRLVADVEFDKHGTDRADGAGHGVLLRRGAGGAAPTMVSGDWQKFIPGAQPGEIMASDYNPVIG